MLCHMRNHRIDNTCSRHTRVSIHIYIYIELSYQGNNKRYLTETLHKTHCENCNAS